MGDSAISALQGLHGQLHTLLPAKTDAQLWAMTGATIMNGLDDYPRKTESTSVADARQLVTFANGASTRMSTLSMWAIQRDNGGWARSRRAPRPLRRAPPAPGAPR